MNIRSVVQKNNHVGITHTDSVVRNYLHSYCAIWIFAIIISVMLWINGAISFSVLILFGINMFISGYIISSNAKKLSNIAVVLSAILTVMSLTMLGLIVYRPDFGPASMHYYAQITIALGIVVSLLINKLWLIKVETPRERIDAKLVNQDEHASTV